MQIINVIDEKGRFTGLKFGFCAQDGQFDSHTYSYVYAREAMGSPAFDNLTDEDFTDKGYVKSGLDFKVSSS